MACTICRSQFPLSRRLAIVQQQLRQVLPAVLETPISLISICAGQGHDLFGVLEDYPYAHQVHARLVELDERNVQIARNRAATLGLDGVQVVRGDAPLLAEYEGAAPADIVIACGVFGNFSDEDIYHAIDLLPQLCAQEATVVWTGSRRPPDVTPAIRRYLANHAFTEVDFVAPDDVLFSVSVNRFTGEPEPLQPDQRMFTFTASK